ncbi:MAG: C40 family peptidase [Flavobacteriales bacterium]
MDLVVCPLSIVPVRKDPSDRAEMVTQWLFGETAEVMERQEKWSRLKFHLDAYEGWVDNKQSVPTQYALPIGAKRSIEATSAVDLGGSKLILPMGAVVDLPERADAASAEQKDPKETGKSTADLTGPATLRAMLMTRAFISAPYLWGGRTPWGVDCSGFTQMVYLLAGVPLPRDAYQQAEVGTTIELLDLAQPGDLAFFDNDEGRIVHVGFILPGPDGTHFIVHASGQVRLDKLDQQGIFHIQEKRYTHKLRLVKRVA